MPPEDELTGTDTSGFFGGGLTVEMLLPKATLPDE